MSEELIEHFSWQEVRSGLQTLVERFPTRTPALLRLEKFINKVPKADWGWGWAWRMIRENKLRDILEDLILEQYKSFSQISSVDPDGRAVHRVRLQSKPNQYARTGVSASRSKALAIAAWRAWDEIVVNWDYDNQFEIRDSDDQSKAP